MTVPGGKTDYNFKEVSKTFYDKSYLGYKSLLTCNLVFKNYFCFTVSLCEGEHN